MCEITWGGYIALPPSQHQHCTDEAQKAETVLSAVSYIYNKLLIFMDVLGIFWEVTNQISRLDFSDTFTMFIFSFSFIFVKACFQRLSYKINAAAVDTDDNDGFNNNLAVDDTIDD